MYKIAIIIFIACYSLYAVFTRRPDYFDGNIIPAKVHFMKDSASANQTPNAIYVVNGKTYQADAAYLFKNYRENQEIKIIYEASDPAQGAIYGWWGYWIRWQELLPSIIIFTMLFLGSVSITHNQTEDSKMAQENYVAVKKKKYSD